MIVLVQYIECIGIVRQHTQQARSLVSREPLCAGNVGDQGDRSFEGVELRLLFPEQLFIVSVAFDQIVLEDVIRPLTKGRSAFGTHTVADR